MTLIKYLIGISLAAIALVSCSNSQSLQRYLVDKQEDDNFVKIDLATSLLESESADFNEEQRNILNTVKKINVVAYPLKKGNTEEYNSELDIISKILGQEGFETLGSVKSDEGKLTLQFTGEVDAIDEVIFFASSDDKGFAVFRLLGDDMQPGQMIKLMNSIDSGDFDVSKLSGIGDLFGGEFNYRAELEEEMGEDMEIIEKVEISTDVDEETN